MSQLGRFQLAPAFAANFAIRLCAFPASFVATFLLSRLLGASQYGLYAYALAWSSMLAAPAALGLDGLLTRDVARSRALQDWGVLRGLLTWSPRLIWGASLLLMGLGAAAILLVLDKRDSPMTLPLIVGLMLVPLLALRQANCGVLQGLGRPLLGAIPEFLVHPLAVLALVLLAALVAGRHFSAEHAILIQVFAGAGALLSGRRLLKQALPPETASQPRQDHVAGWVRAAAPFFVAQLLFLANGKLSLLILGALAPPRDVGIFALCASLASYVSLALVTINPVIAGQLAQLHARGKQPELQQVLTVAVRLCLLVSLPVALLETAGGDWLLGLFGDEFVGGATSLRILVAAQLINSAAGSVGLVLNMSGHAQDTVVGAAVSAAAACVASVLLIPRFGVNGAALAQGSGVVVFNVILALKARQRLGLNTTIFAGVRREAA